MSRAGTIIVAQVVAAALAVGAICWSLIMEIMRPSLEAVESARMHALLAIVLITIAVMAAVRRLRTIPVAAAVAAVVVTLAAGVWPHLISQIERRANAARFDARQRAELAAHDAKALARIDKRTHDVEARLAENRPYAGQDALDFVDEVDLVDLKYLGLPNRSETMLALLRRALAAKLVDPNVPVKGPRPVDVNIEPLFLHYYRANIRRYPGAPVRLLHWEILKLLVASGADLALAPGHPIAEDLQKGLRTDQFGNDRLD